MRLKPHSNKSKRLRHIAKSLAAESDVLLAHKVRVGDKVKLQPFWQYGCAKRICRDMKRDGWGGNLKRLARLVEGVTDVQETKRV